MKLLFLLIAISISTWIKAQQTITIQITDEKNKVPVSASILVKGQRKGLATDSNGVAIISFPANGNYTLTISAIGFGEKQFTLTIPHDTDTLQIGLETEAHELEEVIIQSTRTSRTIANVPTRIETIELEEIDEKSNMRPANVSMILHESTGIQVQQTSATSGNASIRLQGLDGRYTQLLKDGFPNFGNFSSGLSVLEIPPLDLKQVEIIKGPASPLYGGGAIAGVINFVSKTPGMTPTYNFILNQSNIGQTNIGGFASARKKKMGYTLLALYNHSNPYDVDDDDFTEVPKSSEFTIHPRLFIYPGESTTISFGSSLTRGKRTGGDIYVIRNKEDASHQYVERNKSLRSITTLEIDRRLSEKKRLVGKQSLGVFDRSIDIPGYHFSGVEYTAFTDLAYIGNGKQHDFVLGANLNYSRFNEKPGSSLNRDNTAITGGLYGQHTWDPSDLVKLETGLRFDIAEYKNPLYQKTELFVLPRVSLLVKYSPAWHSRISAGMGYKTPTLFTEETETRQYQQVEQLNNVQSEKSYGGTVDINFRTHIGEDFSISFNHMFFYTWIAKPLILENYTPGSFRFINAGKSVRSMGFETNARFVYKENFKLFLGYTYTDIQAGYRTGNQFLPLVPRGKLNSALIYEKEDKIKLGLEGYFTGKQYLSDGTRTATFYELGFMAEKLFRKFSVYINFENFTDTRQSRYKNVVNGSHLNPTFDEIWTHTEGFIVNGGIKVKL